jgi:RNA polymerase sigma-70 factor, ECF subfamily
LVNRFQAGDQEAFAVLYRRYHPRVLAFLVQRVRDQHLAEDLAADTFTRALGALPELQVHGELDGWLFTIARNLMTDHFRRSETRRMSSVAHPGVATVDERSPEAAPESTAVGRADVLDALRHLEPRHRAVIVHRVLLDLSVQDTATALGWHISMVKHQLRRALWLLGETELVRAEVAFA